jgi:hypothetical protein
MKNKFKVAVSLVVALLFAGVMSGVVSGVTGWSQPVVFGVMAVASVMAPVLLPADTLRMALIPEVWLDTIVGNLWPDNSFITKSVDHSAFADKYSVHVPNAGAPPGVTMDRTSYPATIGTRTDIDLSYLLHQFQVDPVRIPNAEEVQLSYDKRESVIGQSRMKLQNEVHGYILGQWITDAPAITPEANIKASIKAAKEQFDSDDVPLAGRCAMLDATQYNALLDSLTDAQVNGFLAGADPVAGLIGKWMGFDFYMRSTLDGTRNGFFWHTTAVSRAISQPTLFDNQKRAEWYSDIVSLEIFAGGKFFRNDAKGALKLTQ